MKNSEHYLYATWGMMRHRCNSPKSQHYKNYGGRGIKVCPEWDDFWQFVKDMGERPEGHTLDRIDNDKGYSKENCRWASQTQQTNNTRSVKKAKGYNWNKTAKKYQARISINGEFQTLGYFDNPEDAHAAYLQARENKLATIY